MSHKIAQFSLDFVRTASVCVVAMKRPPMDLPPETIETTLKVFLREIRSRLDEAASIARAAETCADTGNIPKGIEITLDVEQLLYEVNTLLNAASLIQRIGKSQ